MERLHLVWQNHCIKLWNMEAWTRCTLSQNQDRFQCLTCHGEGGGQRHWSWGWTLWDSHLFLVVWLVKRLSPRALHLSKLPAFVLKVGAAEASQVRAQVGLELVSIPQKKPQRPHEDSMSRPINTCSTIDWHDADCTFWMIQVRSLSRPVHQHDVSSYLWRACLNVFFNKNPQWLTGRQALGSCGCIWPGSDSLRESFRKKQGFQTVTPVSHAACFI